MEITRLAERLRKNITKNKTVKLLPALNGTAHELMMLFRDKEETVTTWPDRGGQPTTYLSMKSSIGGNLTTVINQSVTHAISINRYENRHRPAWARDEVCNRITHSINTKQNVTFCNSPHHLIDKSEDQIHLQQILGWSYARYQEHGKEFHKLTGYNVMNIKNTPSKAAKGIVPQFIIEEAKLLVDMELKPKTGIAQSVLVKSSKCAHHCYLNVKDLLRHWKLQHFSMTSLKYALMVTKAALSWNRRSAQQ
jgi:hypothetical protein